MRKSTHQGFWVKPKFPFLGCSPDGRLLAKTLLLIEIRSLKILKQYSVKTVTSPTSLKVEDGKCILKRSHAYYYRCQHILLVTDSDCDFILHAANRPDSEERIPRVEPLIVENLAYLRAFWARVIATEIFEMRVPRGLVPFVLSEAADFLDSIELPPASPDSCLELETLPNVLLQHHLLAPWNLMHPLHHLTDAWKVKTHTTCTSQSVSPVDSVQPDALPASLSPTHSKNRVTPMSPASLSDLCETTASDLPVSVTKSEQPFPCLCTQVIIYAAEALPRFQSMVRPVTLNLLVNRFTSQISEWLQLQTCI